MNPTTLNGTYTTRFVAYDLCLDIICRLQAPLAVIRRHNASLAKQGTNAIDSVLLNLAEGNGREGGDRLHHFRISLAACARPARCSTSRAPTAGCRSRRRSISSAIGSAA